MIFTKVYFFHINPLIGLITYDTNTSQKSYRQALNTYLCVLAQVIYWHIFLVTVNYAKELMSCKNYLCYKPT